MNCKNAPVKPKKRIYFRWTAHLSRVLGGAVGLLLMVSAVLKATDIVLFIKQVAAYQIISHPLLLTLSAWGLIALECSLGAALILYYRPRITIPIAGFFWILFLAGTSWAWLSGVTDECGCYGTWSSQTPKEGTIENLIFLCVTIIAWTGLPGIKENRTGLKTWTVTAAFLIGAFLPFGFGFPISAMITSPSQSAPSEIGPIDIIGLDVDLTSGDYLVVLMGTDCQHCLEAVPDIDTLAESVDLPRVVALSVNNEAQRQKFVREFEPLFPIGQIRDRDFWALLGEDEIPRIMLLRNGRLLKAWNRSVPDQGTIRSSLSNDGLRLHSQTNFPVK